MADKVSVKLLRPLDGGEVGSTREFDAHEVQALVDSGAVEASGYKASDPTQSGIVHTYDGTDSGDTVIDQNNGQAIDATMTSTTEAKSEAAPANKSRKATDNK